MSFPVRGFMRPSAQVHLSLGGKEGQRSRARSWIDPSGVCGERNHRKMISPPGRGDPEPKGHGNTKGDVIMLGRVD